MEEIGSSIYGLNLSEIVSFLKYFFIAVVLIGAYISIYIVITPHAEIKLIREKQVLED